MSKQTTNKLLDKISHYFVSVQRFSTLFWLKFNQIKDPRVKIITITLVLGAIWMTSGILKFDKKVDNQLEVIAEVRAIISAANKHKVFIEATGILDSRKKVNLYPQVSGNIIEILAKDGQFLKQGEPILIIDPKGTKSKLESSKSALKAAELSYNAEKELYAKGLGSLAALEKAKSAYESKVAAYRDAKSGFDNTKVLAPFDGYLDKIKVNMGDFVSDGIAPGLTDIAIFAAASPLIAVTDLPRDKYNKINLAAFGMVTDGLTAKEAKITFSSQIADLSTRTFRVDLEFKNEPNDFKIGQIVKVKLPRLDTGSLHKLPKSAVVLDAEGRLVVKIVDAHKKAKEVKIDLLSEDQDNFIVSGLPDMATVIVLGAQNANDGDPVAVTYVTHPS